MEPMEHDSITSRRYKEDFDGLLENVKKTEAQMEKMKEILRVIAYPRRGTEEETDYTFAEDVARYIQSNFTLQDLEPIA